MLLNRLIIGNGNHHQFLHQVSYNCFKAAIKRFSILNAEKSYF